MRTQKRDMNERTVTAQSGLIQEVLHVQLMRYKQFIYTDFVECMREVWRMLNARFKNFGTALEPITV